MNVTTYVITLWGMAMVLWMMVHYRTYLKVKNLWILLLFIGSYVFSAVLNYHYGVTNNIKAIIWMVLPIFLLYIASKDYKIWEMKREFFFLSTIYVIYCTIANMVSLSMVYWGRNLEFKDATGVTHAVGFRWGRLWGIYDDPNHGATISVIAMIMAIYLITQVKNMGLKILLSLAFLTNSLYILFSDSRTGMTCIAMGTFALVGIVVFQKIKLVPAGKKVVIVLLLSALSAIVSVGVSSEIKIKYNQMDKKIVSMIAEKNNTNQTKVSHPEAIIGRQKDLVKDTSNGRIELWKEGLQIAKSKPVFGVSYRNIASYAEKNMPESYMVKNSSGIRYDSMHNLEMDILISQGLVGVGLFLFLVISTIIFWIKNIRYIPNGGKGLASMAFVMVFTMAIASTFLSIIFYVNTPQGYCFWLCFGYLMAMMSGKRNTI
ncbi:MAG: O-antigen ligase family protein [Lachnospiraceae bacterium]